MKRDDILEKEAQIRQWISENRSKAFICKELHCKPVTLESYLAKLNIFYKGNQGRKGRKELGRRKLATDYLYTGSKIATHILKLRLLRDGIKPAKCECCKLETWIGGGIPLELHHVNGDRYDNRLENLQLLCPNCHALTDNHAGKAIKHLEVSLDLPKEFHPIPQDRPKNRPVSILVFDSPNSYIRWHRIPLAQRHLINNQDGSFSCQVGEEKCLYCSKLLFGYGQDTYCSLSCFRLASRKVERPSKEELEKLVWIKPTTQIAKEFGVSDKAVEKWCKAYGIEKPPRGYWAKQQSLQAPVAE